MIVFGRKSKKNKKRQHVAKEASIVSPFTGTFFSFQFLEVKGFELIFMFKPF